jgi:hypothetical protein
MGTNAVIDVGIGMFLMYLLLSLVCTIINEFVASILSLRAKTLADGIKKLIDDPDLLTAFQGHGLIEAQSLLAHGQPSYLPGRTVALALIDCLDPNKPVTLVSEVVSAATKLPPSNVRDAILTAAAAVGDDIEKLRTAMSQWFDDAMDRVSGVFKRYAHRLSLAVGVLLAIALNADTIAVANSLWQDGVLRSQITSSASQVVAGNPSTDQLSQTMHSLSSIEADLRPFPIGWSNAATRPDLNWTTGGWTIAQKVVGLLITGLALSLGAPFWFDLLNKFVNLRVTGTKPAKTDAS